MQEILKNVQPVRHKIHTEKNFSASFILQSCQHTLGETLLCACSHAKSLRHHNQVLGFRTVAVVTTNEYT